MLDTHKKNLLLILIAFLSLGLLVVSCSLDAKVDPQSEEYPAPNIEQVSVKTLVSGLNYPTMVRFIDSDDPEGTGEGSVLHKGNFLVANAGTNGSWSNSIVQIDPQNGTVSLFSDTTHYDSNGFPGVDRPTGIDFPGPYPWISNATRCYGSLAALDASPGVGYDGPTSSAGEPIGGPNNQGVFGCSDFRLTLKSITPTNNEADVPLNSVITATFSRPVNPSTVNSDTFIVTLDDADTPTGMNIQKGQIDGTYSFSADLMSVTFTPAQPLLSSTIYELSIYEVKIKNDVLDIYGNPFDADLNTPDDEEDFVSVFTAVRETVPPRVVAIHPLNYQVVTRDTAVVITFSEPIRQDSIDDQSFKVTKADYDGYYYEPEISGDKYYHDGNLILGFIPDDSDWAESSRYFVLLKGTLPTGFEGVQDRAGNALDGDGDGQPGGDFWSSFWTDGLDDPPYVVSFQPRRGATNVPVTTTFDVVFSEPLASATITNRSFLMYWGDGQIPGIVTRSDGYITATFTPYEPLPYNARIDVILTAEIEDVEGNSLDGNNDGLGGDNFYSWFYTGQDPNASPPQVASIQPADGQTDVPISTTISVSFTKAIDPTTLTSASFYLSQGSTPFPGSITIQPGNTSATLTPISSLSYDTVYTVTLTDAITDTFGHALDGDYNGTAGGIFTSTFTTQVDPNSIPVYVLSISPTDGQTNVSTTTSVVATFSRAINPATINSTNFVVANGGNVPGSITLSGGNTIATFTPTNPLLESTTYTVQLIDTIQDPGGMALDGDHNGVPGGVFQSQFTTGATLKVVINEFMAAPSTDWDGSGGFSSSGDEWIEIYNNSAVPADLTGLYLGDSSDPLRFQFGTETLGAFSYRVVYGSEQGSLSLNNSGDTVFLTDADGTTVLDSHAYSSATSDASIERYPDASSNWISTNSCAAPGGGVGCPSPGASNTTPKRNNPTAVTSASLSALDDGTMGIASDSNYPPMLSDNWGFAGVAYGGKGPDEDGENNVIFFASHPKLQDIFLFDFDTGWYQMNLDLEFLFGDFNEEPGRLLFMPQMGDDGNPKVGTGDLWILVPQWDSVVVAPVIPTGPVGTRAVTVAFDRADTYTFYPVTKDPLEPVLLHPIDLVYDEDSEHIFIANRGNGSVAEMDTNGKVLTIYKTNLGMETVSSLDIADWGEGKSVVLTTTGGVYINESSGTYGAMTYFKLSQ